MVIEGSPPKADGIIPISFLVFLSGPLYHGDDWVFPPNLSKQKRANAMLSWGFPEIDLPAVRPAPPARRHRTPQPLRNAGLVRRRATGEFSAGASVHVGEGSAMCRRGFVHPTRRRRRRRGNWAHSFSPRRRIYTNGEYRRWRAMRGRRRDTSRRSTTARGKTTGEPSAFAGGQPRCVPRGASATSSPAHGAR